MTLGLTLHAAAYAGGFKCPPRIGVVAAASSGGDVGFIEEANNQAYQLNSTKEAREHIGHRVRIVAHVIAGTDDTLYVHTLECLDHKSH
jgi:hypothetical protein